MTYELFDPQLVRTGASLCTLCGGKVMNGLNCTTCSMAMWLYRATQGRVKTTGCHVRDLTNDCTGGTNLRQMTLIADHYGVTGYRLYQPIDFDTLVGLIKTGRYGAILDLSYSTIAGGPYDRFHDSFFGNHAVYISGPYTSTTLRVGDPGAGDYASIPISLLKTAAGRLDLGGGIRLGYGKAYALLTPIDPATATTTYKAVITAPSSSPLRLYYAPDGAKDGAVTTATYTVTRSKVAGLWWYRIGGTGGNRGKYFKPNRYTHITVI